MSHNRSTIIGKAGELRVASELLIRGHEPLLAVVDDGVDITLTTGATIQVKTSSGTVVKRGGRYFVFSLNALRERGNTGVSGRRTHRAHMVADFAICWCLGTERFYIIPRAAIGKRDSISIAAEPSRASRWDQWLGCWDLLEG